MGVKECILESVANSNEQQEMHKILCQLNLTITLVKKSLFVTNNLFQDLGRIIDQSNIHDIRQHASLSTSPSNESLAALIDYLNLKSDENAGNFTLSTHDLYEFVRLDPTAIQALHLMPLNDNSMKSTQSLFSILNHCQTAQGSRLLSQWIKQPLLSMNDIGYFFLLP